MKALVFDMDGTIADLYKVKGWLEMLQREDATPYEIAKPIYDMDTLNEELNILKTLGWKIIITSWLSKGSSKRYDEKVKKAKTNWLNTYKFPYDEIHLVAYGTDKATITKNLGGYQILFDDDEQVRNLWNLGLAIDAKQNILEKLADLIIG